MNPNFDLPLKTQIVQFFGAVFFAKRSLGTIWSPMALKNAGRQPLWYPGWWGGNLALLGPFWGLFQSLGLCNLWPLWGQNISSWVCIWPKSPGDLFWRVFHGLSIDICFGPHLDTYMEIFRGQNCEKFSIFRVISEQKWNDFQRTEVELSLAENLLGSMQKKNKTKIKVPGPTFPGRTLQGTASFSGKNVVLKM